MSPIFINPLHTDDIDELIDVAHRAWHAHYPGIITVEQIEYMLERSYNRALILNEITNQAITWLAITDGATMIGFISIGPCGSDALKLHKLYLLPEYHDKGIGARALARVEEIAQKALVHKIVLNVNKHNPKAIRSYERAGWQIAAEVINDIGNGYIMDDYIMTKQI